MAENRSQEQYRDPDYSQFQTSQSQTNDNKCDKHPNDKQDAKPKSTESRREAICRVIEREFQRELANKEQEMREINQTIVEAKELLRRVRYAVVYHYYHRKSVICTEEEIAAVQKAQQEEMTSYPPPGDKPQLAIHPSVKKLLGKRPYNIDDLLKGRATRRAAQNATEQFQKMAKKPAETRIRMRSPIFDDEANDEIECKKPRYVAPSAPKQIIDQVNSARGRNSYRHLLAVGNVSKYIGDEEAGLATSVTHKWLIYIASKTDVPIEQIVNRVRFHLHESYKPNDVAEISCPPFQLTKRGWGEFPVRVQLYFHEHIMQKPVQIFHTLVLDKKHTGLQTMGAETIVEVWLNIPNTLNNEADAKDDEISQCSSSQADSSKPTETEPSSSMISASIPSTSSQLTSNSTAVANHSHSEMTMKQELMDIQSDSSQGKIHRNGQNSGINSQSQPISTPVAIKSEPSPQVTTPLSSPSPKICDQNNANVSNVVNKPVASAVTPLKMSGKKTFIKCVGKDGKVSLMELVRDDKNPKLFKMVAPQGNRMVVQQTMTPIRPVAPTMVINPTNLVRPVISLASNMAKSIRINTPIAGPSGVRSAYIQQITGNLPNASGHNAIVSSNVTLNSPLIRPILSLRSPNQIMNRTSSPLNASNISQNSPNHAFSLPKLVAINSPLLSSNSSPQAFKSTSTPPIRLQHSNQPATGTRIIHNNNKILVLDSSRITKNPSQSLLKPQMSLLKPRPPSTNVKKITVSNISGIDNKNINVFVPVNVDRESSAGSKGSIRRRFGDELEKLFIECPKFTNMTEAIVWLFKKLPLTSKFAMKTEFRESFPFIVATLQEFHRLHPAKQRNFEWLRAKYVNRLVAKHPSFSKLPKWSTKEIVLFGRWFGYTPQSVFNLKNPKTLEQSENAQNTVKSEMPQPHLHTDVISFNTMLLKWIEGVEDAAMKCMIQSNDEQMIVVDENEDDATHNKSTSPLKTSNNCMQLPIENGLNEIMWINEVCRKTQIRFEQEEIVEGISHRSAELVFGTALKCFVEDLLRKCSGIKHRVNDRESVNPEICNDDVLRTISTIQRFDFLTNKNLGIEKTNSNL